MIIMMRDYMGGAGNFELEVQFGRGRLHNEGNAEKSRK